MAQLTQEELSQSDSSDAQPKRKVLLPLVATTAVAATVAGIIASGPNGVKSDTDTLKVETPTSHEANAYTTEQAYQELSHPQKGDNVNILVDKYTIPKGDSVQVWTGAPGHETVAPAADESRNLYGGVVAVDPSSPSNLRIYFSDRTPQMPDRAVCFVEATDLGLSNDPSQLQTHEVTITRVENEGGPVAFADRIPQSKGDSYDLVGQTVYPFADYNPSTNEIS